MKKMIISCLSAASILFLTSASATSKYPVTIVNNSSFTITANYYMCDAQKKLCGLIQQNSIGSVQSGNNHFSVVGLLNPKTERFTLSAAVAKDNNGKIIATLANSCDLPASASTVDLRIDILSTNGTSKISCYTS